VNYSLSAKFQQSQYTYLKADVLADDGWNIGYPALPMDVGYAAARIASLSLHHENAVNRFYKWQVKIYANKIRHFMDDTKRPFVPMHMDMPGISKTYGVYSEGEMKINHKQKLLLRADGSSTFLKASMTMYQSGQLPMYMLTWPDNRKNQYGVSASWLYQVDSTIKVQVASRVDYITHNLVSQEAKDQVNIFGYPKADRSDFLKNISAQVSKKLSGKIKTTASISFSERTPTPSELYGFYLFNSNDGYDYIGNPQLKLEKSLQTEVSAQYNWGTNQIQITYYYSKIFNYIAGIVDPSLSAMTIGANGVKSFINIPNASVTGLEASAVIKPSTTTDIVSTIRYTLGKDNHNNPLPFIAPLKNITSVRYQLNKLSLQLESEAALKQNRVSSTTGEDITAGYFLLHSRLGYNTKIFKNNMEIQAGVENILDKQYHEHLDWGNINRPGRNVYAQIKIFF
jgi:iron complex outermembrane receptor protein